MRQNVLKPKKVLEQLSGHLYSKISIYRVALMNTKGNMHACESKQTHMHAQYRAWRQ